MLGEKVSQITCSHMKSSSLYRKIHAKTGVDQGHEGANLQATSMIDLFFFLQTPWTLQRMKGSRGGGEEL